jgi:hypothetical protein
MSSPTSRRASSTGIALGTMVSASAAPYGYTVSLWSTGALITHYRGSPGVGQVFLFAAGALLAFSVVGLGVRPILRAQGPMEDGHERVLVGALHWFSVGAAAGTAALIGHVNSGVDWILASFAATALYLLISSVQLAFAYRGSSGARAANPPGS